MAKLNASLFGPLERIESAARRAANLLTSSNVTPKDSELIAQEIREMAEGLAAFRAAVEAGERSGVEDCSLRSNR